MLYHKDCKQTDAREYGYPLRCIEHVDTLKAGWYRCPACDEIIRIADNEPLPPDVTQED